MRPLTPTQQKIVTEIQRFKTEHGYSPTVRELREAAGLASPATVHHHLDVLERLGVVSREPNKPRTIVVNRQESDRVDLLDDPSEPDEG